MDLDDPADDAPHDELFGLLAEVAKVRAQTQQELQERTKRTVEAVFEHDAVELAAKRRRDHFNGSLRAALTQGNFPTLAGEIPRPTESTINYALHADLAKLLPRSPTAGANLATTISCLLPMATAQATHHRTAFNHMARMLEQPLFPGKENAAFIFWLLGHSAYEMLVMTRVNAGLLCTELFELEAKHYGTHERADIYPPLGPHDAPPVVRHSMRYRFPFLRHVLDAVVDAGGSYCNGESLKLLATVAVFSLFPCPVEHALPPAVLRRLAMLRRGDPDFAARIGAAAATGEPWVNPDHPVWQDDVGLAERYVQGLPPAAPLGLDWRTLWRGRDLSLLDAMSQAHGLFERLGPSNDFFEQMVWLYQCAVDLGDPAQEQDMISVLGEWKLPFGW